MRDDELNLPLPPTDDRPGDSWFPKPCEERDEPGRHLTWHGKRRRWFLFAGICVLLVCLGLPAVVPTSILFKPGPLSKPHAQILAGTVVSQRCASCHQQNALSPFSIFSFGNSSEKHHDTNQLDLCMDCHKATIEPNLAAAAHNLPLSVRDQLTKSLRLASSNKLASRKTQSWIPNAAVDQDDVQCSACHREHHGIKADLLVMSNQQCQTCHSQRFDHFGADHPDWKQWPYGRGGQISFDHGTHSTKHFPNWKGGVNSFECSSCHTESNGSDGFASIANGELMRSSSFEVSCANCHDESMRVQLDAGLEFVALPMIPSDVARQVGGWPESATGFADGIIPPLTELLLRADPELAEMMREIPAGDISRIQGGDARAVPVLRGVAKGIQSLLDEVGKRGQVAIEERLQKAGVSTQAIGPLLCSLSPQLISSAKSAWQIGDAKASLRQANVKASNVRLVAAGEDDLLLSNDFSDDLAGDDLGGDLLSEDPLAEDPLTEDLLMDDPLSEDPLAEDPLEMGGSASGIAGGDCPDCELSAQDQVRHGGWYRDDVRLSLRYRAASHSNSVMSSMIELFGQLGETDPLKERFFQQTAVQACVTCHSSAGSFPSAWKAGNLIGKRSEFTKFSHRPHLNISALGDCQHCHQIKGSGPNESGQSIEPEIQFTDFGLAAEPRAIEPVVHHDFETLGRETCAACHQAAAAGNSCTTCHRYHIDW